MSFVSTTFPLPSVTMPNGAVALQLAPRCSIFRGKTSVRPAVNTIRRAEPRARLTVVSSPRQVALGSFLDAIGKVMGIAGKAAAGFAAGGPAGAVTGAASGIVGGGGKKQEQQQTQVVQQQPAGPLANVSTGVIVASALGFSGLIIALARGR